MNLQLTRRDGAAVLLVAAVTALATSLGAGLRLALELGAAATVLLLVAVLLRPGPRWEPPPPTLEPRSGPLERDVATVMAALGSGWGAGGGLRRALRAAVEARAALHGTTLDEVLADGSLTPELATLLGPGGARREHGVTADELDRLLAATEDLAP